MRRRRVDIILEDPDHEHRETWIELKSWAAQSINGAGRGKFEQARSAPLAHWSSMSARGRTAFHRQFSLDRGAVRIGKAWLNRAESGEPDYSAQVDVFDFYWYFQAFDVKSRKPPHRRQVSPSLGGPTQEGSIRNFLSEQPLRSSRGKYVQARETTFGNSPTIGRQARIKTPAEMIRQLTAMGYGELFAELDLDFSALEE